MDSLVPKETDEEIIQDLESTEDTSGLWLYRLIKVKSSDVGFTWKTSMLLYKIMTWAEESETEEDFLSAVQYFNNGILMPYCKPYSKEIFEYSRKMREENKNR